MNENIRLQKYKIRVLDIAFRDAFFKKNIIYTYRYKYLNIYTLNVITKHFLTH